MWLFRHGSSSSEEKVTWMFKYDSIRTQHFEFVAAIFPGGGGFFLGGGFGCEPSIDIVGPG